MEKSNISQDTPDIIRNISRDIRDGGCYKIGNLSVTEMLVAFHLSGCGKQLLHADNAVISEGNATAKHLEETYTFNKEQQQKLLPIAKLRLPRVK
eukprot:14309919-Ditylum_brightwellii.AAC.1